MELRHIRYFIAVAEELSFVRAAKRLHISQPPLSQTIRQLEDQLAIELFDRARRQIELTDAGQIFLQQARLVLIQVERAADLAISAKRGEVGQLRVGFMDPEHTLIATEVFRAFSVSHPQVHLTSLALAPAGTISAVQDGRVDLAFLRLASEGAGVVIEPVLREPLVVAMSDDHALSARKAVSLDALKGEACILRAQHRDPAYYDFVLAALKKARVSVKFAYAEDGIYTSLGLIAAGQAVSLLPANILQLPIKHLTFRNLDPPNLYVETEIAYKADNKSAVLAQFLDVARQVCREWKFTNRHSSKRRE